MNSLFMMMKALWNLILIHILMATSFALAANDYREPVIFSGRYDDANNRCKIVSIHSFTEKQGKAFAQTGVGWVIVGEDGYSILTPSHVVSGADLILGECNGRYFPLSLQSKTETLDLALLNPLTDVKSLVVPLILLQNRKTVSAATDQRFLEILRLFHPDHFQKGFDYLLSRQDSGAYEIPQRDRTWSTTQFKSTDHIQVGIAHFDNALSSLAVESMAIQPGFSGAPFYIQVPKTKMEDRDFVNHLFSPDTYYQYYLVGMLTKAEVNGSRSLGLSMPVILKILPFLMQTKDPSADVISFVSPNKLRLRYTNTVKGDYLERGQELVYTYQNGEQKIFTEICEDATVDSSEWNAAPKEKDIATHIKEYRDKRSASEKVQKFETILRSNKGTIDKVKSVLQRTSGGDYGEGGGSALTLKHSRLMSPDRRNHIIGGDLTSYKRDRPCQKVVLKDNFGKTYDSMMIHGKLEKTTNLAEAYAALSKGLATGSGSITGPLCSSYDLQEDRSVGTYYKATATTPAYTYYRSEGYAVPSGTRDGRSIGSLQCRGEAIHLKLTEENTSLDLTLGNLNQVRGFVQLNSASCRLNVTTANYSMANRWKHQIRSPMVDLDININQDGRILSIKFLRIAENCEIYQNSRLWMKEMNFSTEKAMEQKSYVRHLLRSLKEDRAHEEQ